MRRPKEKADDETAEQSQLATVLPQEVPVAARRRRRSPSLQEPPPDAPQVDAIAESPRTETAGAPVRDARARTRSPGAPRRRLKRKARRSSTTAALPSSPRAASAVGAPYNLGELQRHGLLPSRAPQALSGRCPARRYHGRSQRTFSLDGGGRVTSVRLARGSGLPSIDQEVVAMVRRASPFPRAAGRPRKKLSRFPCASICGTRPD